MAEILESVRSKYGAVAESALSSSHAGVKAVAEAFGYSAEELTSIPSQANMGLSCGNPTATAHLRPGEVVVDLGSGGGLDVFLASKMVGPEGRAIGIDMTPAMIERARANAMSGGYANVEFYQSTIDRVPLPNASVDCVISNCVLNLAPDKQAVLLEIARILKPGGRLAVSDIALKGELPEAISRSMAAYVGCIAGALRIDDYRAGLLAAGFEHVEIVDSGSDLNAYAKVENQSGCCSPAMEGSGCCSPASSAATFHEELSDLLSHYDVNAAAASVKVYAIKPMERAHPAVVDVMQEIGIDLSHAKPRKLKTWGEMRSFSSPWDAVTSAAPTALSSVFFADPGLPAWADVWRAGPPGLVVVTGQACLPAGYSQ